ncbi:alpha-glucosidase [Dongshaea marina]|uniref:alpha-glucosidase n=1 Tax=Dongshaea marina TaxID=2047966 RepID=UPI000D3EAD5A|nr:alpha-glucosidase [Dongshaea marina]
MNKSWWKEAIVYQIYPRSFNDANADGIGDLRGIIDKIDYIASLGINTIWLNPVYESPFDDMGYDIADYKNIASCFGSMADFDELLEKAHQRDIRILMDLVVNHCSDEHHWFTEAKQSKQSPYHDYFVWRDAGESREHPNNWISFFSGPAWEYNPQTDEYYLHYFSKKQPDLNWENPNVREEVQGIMEFWLAKGVDGFRMDVIGLISKPPGLPDIPEDTHDIGAFYNNGPRLHEFLQDIHAKVLSRYDCMTVGECPGATAEDALLLCGEDRRELQTLFHFEAMDVDKRSAEHYEVGKVSVPKLREVMQKWHDTLYGKSWNSAYLMNHDQPRSVSRFGDDDRYRIESAKMLATFQLTQWGTPYIYQGEEIGMTNCHFEPQEFRDIQMINYYREQRELGKSKEELLPGLLYKGRDNSRTPMQWDSSKNAGFSSSDNTWIKINPNYPAINVDAAERDPESILHYYRSAIALRKAHPILTYGRQELIELGDDALYGYLRKDEQEELWVILSFDAGEKPIRLKGLNQCQPLLGNYPAPSLKEEQLTLRPYEALVLKRH